MEELRKMIYIDGNGRKVLNLMNNNLSKVPSALSELTELEVLDLSFNQLKQVTGINKLKNLKQLDLSANKLNEFPESVCELEKLEVLSVMYNNLKVLPNSVCKLKRLWGLNLSDNKLSSLPNDFAELEELVSLFLNNNELRVLPNSVCKMKELRWLNLSDNNLSSLPDGFAELKLDELYVSGNPFTVEERRKVKEIRNRIKRRRDEAGKDKKCNVCCLYLCYFELCGLEQIFPC